MGNLQHQNSKLNIIVPIIMQVLACVLLFVLQYLNSPVIDSALIYLRPRVVTLLLIAFTMAMGFDKFRYWLVSKIAFVGIFWVSDLMLPHRWGGGFINLTPPFPWILIFVVPYLICLEFIAWAFVKIGKRIIKHRKGA